MKKLVAILIAIALLCSCMVACAESYTAVGQGIGGDVPVTVTIEDGRIVSIDVGDNSETAGIGSNAIEQLPGKIVEAQSLAVDVIGGATVTSTAILTAVETAITEAGLDVEAFKTAPAATELVQGETETTQVVIVGGGLSGLMAAYELKDNHPEVDYILVEKLDMLTGSIPGTGGAIIATKSVLHTADGSECTVQDIIDLFEYTSGTDVNEALVSNVYEDSDVVLNRLVSWGTNFTNPQVSSKYSDEVISYWHENRGAGLAAAMNAYMAENPANVRTGTKVESLLVEDGRVVGVHCTDNEKEYDIRANYVILATGGFGSSEEYMNEYLPLFADGYSSTNAGATGDGITMTAQFGTKIVGDGSMGSLVAPDGSALISVNFLVNQEGVRFIGEGEPKYVIQRAVSQQSDKAAFLIADASYADMDTINAKMEKGYVKQYDTLEELAADNGIDVETLLDTVAAYNAAADAGEEIPATEYSLAAASATKVETAPYYIEKVTLRTFGTIPGAEVNEYCQILDGEGNPVEGLYGVGEFIAGNAFTRQYPGAGVGISWAANTGRYVADEVAELLK